MLRREILYILLLVASVGLSAAHADKLTNGNYILYDSINSGGQSLTDQNNTYKLYNSGSEWLGKRMESGDMVFIPGILGLLGTTQEGIITGDNGLVQGLVIERIADTQKSRVRLTWKYKTGSGVTSADIWRMANKITQYSSADAKVWEQAVSGANPPWDDKFLDSNGEEVLVGNGVNAYYRVVPAGTQKAEIFTAKSNARTASKVDVEFGKGYTLFEIPDWPVDLSISKVIGDQLDKKAGGDEVYDYSMNKSNYENGTWVGNPLVFEKGRGYYLRILNTPKALTFVGVAFLDPMDLTLNNGYSMVGNPYPLVKEIDSAFTSASDNDELYDKFANKKTFVGKWVGVDFKFGIGDGFWFRRISANPYAWKLIP